MAYNDQLSLIIMSPISVPLCLFVFVSSSLSCALDFVRFIISLLLQGSI